MRFISPALLHVRTHNRAYPGCQLLKQFGRGAVGGDDAAVGVVAGSVLKYLEVTGTDDALLLDVDELHAQRQAHLAGSREELLLQQPSYRSPTGSRRAPGSASEQRRARDLFFPWLARVVPSASEQGYPPID